MSGTVKRRMLIALCSDRSLHFSPNIYYKVKTLIFPSQELFSLWDLAAIVVLFAVCVCIYIPCFAIYFNCTFSVKRALIYLFKWQKHSQNLLAQNVTFSTNTESKNTGDNYRDICCVTQNSQKSTSNNAQHPHLKKHFFSLFIFNR